MHGANAIMSLRLKRRTNSWCGFCLHRTSFVDRFLHFLLNFSLSLLFLLFSRVSVPGSTQTARWIFATIIIHTFSLGAMHRPKSRRQHWCRSLRSQTPNASSSTENKNFLHECEWRSSPYYDVHTSVWDSCKCLSCSSTCIARGSCVFVVPQLAQLNREHIYFNNFVTFAQLYAVNERTMPWTTAHNRDVNATRCVCVCAFIENPNQCVQSVSYFYYFSIWCD